MQTKETTTIYPSKKKDYTYEDYVNLPDDGNRYEIIDGELIKLKSPNTIHNHTRTQIMFKIMQFLEKNNLGEVLHAPLDVLFSQRNVVQPDLFFISKENKKIITEDNIQGAPDLIIEILSPTTAYYDLIEKKEMYEKFGVKEYWIVDPKKQWMEVYVLEGIKYKLDQREEQSGKIHSSILEGFELELRKVFREWG